MSALAAVVITWPAFRLVCRFRQRVKRLGGPAADLKGDALMLHRPGEDNHPEWERRDSTAAKPGQRGLPDGQAAMVREQQQDADDGTGEPGLSASRRTALARSAAPGLRPQGDWIQRASNDMPGARRNSGRRRPTPTRIASWIDPHTTYTALRAIQLSVRRRASTAVVSAMQPSSAAGVIATSGRIDNLE